MTQTVYFSILGGNLGAVTIASVFRSAGHKSGGKQMQCVGLWCELPLEG